MKMVLYKTIRHFFPSLGNWLNQIKDPRNKNSTDYTITELCWVGILLFLLKLGSRRQINFQFTNKQFMENLSALTEAEVKRIAHDGTLAYLLERLSPESLSGVIRKMLNRLIRMKCFTNYKLMGYYTIAIDVSGHLVFKNKHCDRCLTKRINGKVLYYYHPILEAKLVFANGLAISIETEFIENIEGESIQDCELNAFYRLAPRLKKNFPQLKICLLLDALYANQEALGMCEKNNWKYMITFKKGSMPATYEEYINLKPLHEDCVGQYELKGTNQQYQWVKDINHEGHLVNVLECKEIKNGIPKRFVWLTNFNINKYNYCELANNGGRLRWKIENEGFNIQKNGGYNLEHAYSKHPQAMKNFYILLQIAHAISQLMEKGSLLMAEVKKTFGSIRNFTQALLESLRTSVFDLAEIHSVKSSGFQIRLRAP